MTRKAPSYDAIVLAGGSGRRLGGVDKAALFVGGKPLLSRALDAVQGACRCVVVGPPRALPAQVVGVTEEPPGGGPVAGLAAGLAEVTEALVVVLACDMPFVDCGLVQRLVMAVADDGPGVSDGRLATTGQRSDGALLVDDQGRRQLLAAVYRTAPLLTALSSLGAPSGAAMRALIAPLSLAEVPATPQATLDCDTWESVARSRHLLEDT